LDFFWIYLDFLGFESRSFKGLRSAAGEFDLISLRLAPEAARASRAILSLSEGVHGSEGLRHGDGDLEVLRLRRTQVAFLFRSVKLKARPMPPESCGMVNEDGRRS